jgi:anion-transporting  ArsA/GET3 family ATPase
MTLEGSPSPQILFVTGKGGVGKSTVALAYAQKFAQQGLKTLLVEMGDHSYVSEFLGLPELGYNPIQLRVNLSAVCWRGEQCLREYVLHYLKLQSVYRIFFENRVMRALVDIAPGLKEISLLGKITSGIRHIGPAFAYQRVVVDCFATGHALAFFRAPRGLAEAIRVGPMGEQSRTIDQVLRDSRYCSYKIVTLLEELPVTETEELKLQLNEVLQVEATVIVNKVLHAPLERERIETLAPQAGDFARYLADTMNRQDSFRTRLAQATTIEAEIPLLFERDPWQLITHVQASLT